MTSQVALPGKSLVTCCEFTDEWSGDDIVTGTDVIMVVDKLLVDIDLVVVVGIIIRRSGLVQMLGLVNEVCQGGEEFGIGRSQWGGFERRLCRRWRRSRRRSDVSGTEGTSSG